MKDFSDYLFPINLNEFNDDSGYTDGQLGKHIITFKDEIPDISQAEIVIVGINEYRGSSTISNNHQNPNQIRKALYALHYWHTDIQIADLGNIITGAEISDSYAALKIVVTELIKENKTVLIIGGSHDITLAQCDVYKNLNQIVEATCVDAMIDLRGESHLKSDSFLLDMLTAEPNNVKHYNHIGFQSYFVHPTLLETMDKLRFDCFRLGVVKNDIEEMEPVIRNSNFLSFDISSIKNSDAPANKLSANGLNGEEACTLAQYAGMSSNLNSFGIYGYLSEQDEHQLTAKQIAQMIWYFIDGKHKSKQEANLNETNAFNEFHTFFAEVDTLFLQSKRSNRWWMKLPNQKYIACSQKDYIKASNNEMPERWLRALERA